jgi:ankyrin repeat protein
MERAIVAVLVVVAACACDPGPPPEVPSRAERVDYKKDWFPTSSEEPLPLDAAIQRGDLSEVRRLLAAGANPNARWSQSGDRFPLQEVLEGRPFGYRIDDPAELIRLLLKHGADPNAKWCPFESRVSHDSVGPVCTSDSAMTPLMRASFTDSREIVAMLLAAGADPTQRDWGRASALDYAYDEVIFEMISRALFPDVPTRDQKALDWVSKYEGSPYDSSLWRETPVTRALTQHEGVVFPGAPPPPPQSKLPYRAERETRTISRLRTLLRIGADPNQRLTLAGVDSTPLSLALRANQLRSARTLLEHHSDVNLRWCTQYVLRDYKQIPTVPPGCSLSTGMTPLMWAASANAREAAELLLEFNADRSLKDWAGRTAVDYASTPGMKEVLAAGR